MALFLTTQDLIRAGGLDMQLYREGMLEGSAIHGELCEIVSGAKPGRESDAERIYFSTVGMAHVDLAVAAALAEEAKARGLGMELEFTPFDLMDPRVANLRDEPEPRPRP